MRGLCRIFIFITIASFSLPAVASDQKLVNGAGTLKGGTFAFSLDLGLDIPEPLLYGLRLDVGLGDRVQIGVGTTIFVAMNTFGLSSKFTLFQTEEESDFLSVYLDPSIVHLAGFAFDDDLGSSVWIFLLRTGLAYEHRFGTERRTGLYVKVGSLHLLGATANGQFFGGGFGSDTTAITITPGIQYTTGRRFAGALEGMIAFPLSGIQSSVDVGYGGKIGLSWFF